MLETLYLQYTLTACKKPLEWFLQLLYNFKYELKNIHDALGKYSGLQHIFLRPLEFCSNHLNGFQFDQKILVVMVIELL
jgi:hypothetical protein